MKVLNLVDQEKSNIKYKISSFPDGQQQINITHVDESFDSLMNGRISILTEISKIDPLTSKVSVQIKSRLNNFQDLELIIAATQSLKLLGVKDIHLYVPYFLGSRSDRCFEKGSNNYLKHVICPIINSQGYNSVTVLDPHSDVLEACLNGFRKESNRCIFNWLDIEFKSNKVNINFFNPDKSVWLSPDAGANKKIYKLAEQINYKGDIITCSKERDDNGKLTKCIVPHDWDYDKDVIIIDDICDGGNTFINIAKIIKQYRSSTLKGRTYLIVTHGIFSKGFGELSKYFDGIYCTDSYSSINKHNVHYQSIRGINFNQLNIFND